LAFGSLDREFCEESGIFSKALTGIGKVTV
jgi:hypothetical protein